MEDKDFKFRFGSWSSKNIDTDALKKEFEEYDFDGEIFYLSKEIFHHDIENECDGDFEYRYVIRVVDYAEYGLESGEIGVEVYMIPKSQTILKNLNDMDCEYEQDFSKDYYLDAVREGYSILFDSETISYDLESESDGEEKMELAKERAKIAANMYRVSDRFRGFYLDRCINRIGTTGWDLLNDWVYGKGNFIQATLARFKDN